MPIATDDRLRPATRGDTGETAGAVDTESFLASLKKILERPLTSYHLVLGVSGLLLVFGLVMVLSASSVYSLQLYDNSYYVFYRQALWVAIGLPVAYLASRLPLKMVRWLAWPALLMSAVLICATYLPGVGMTVNGNRNWISFGGPFQLQPSELAKLALVLWIADVYARKDELLTQWRHLLVPMMPVSIVVVGLIVGQSDLGTALVIFGILLGMLWIVGAPAKLFIGSLLAVVSFAFLLASTQPERVARLTGFLNPIAQYGSGGWQASHGFFALATGGIWGLGIGASSQKWGGLPEAHTDYIFAIIGEEFGLFGTLVVLGLFVLLAYAGIRIATRTDDRFVRFASAGIVVWLLGQTVINIGMVLGLLPVIGIPLPLISYGGSALVPTLVALGLLLSFARNEPEAKVALQARGRLLRRRTAR